MDFYCPDLKLAVEVDGVTHYGEEEIQHDINRQLEIEKLNIHFLRFTNLEIYEDRYNVIEKIKVKIKELQNTNKTPEDDFQSY